MKKANEDCSKGTTDNITWLQLMYSAMKLLYQNPYHIEEHKVHEALLQVDVQKAADDKSTCTL